MIDSSQIKTGDSSQHINSMRGSLEGKEQFLKNYMTIADNIQLLGKDQRQAMSAMASIKQRELQHKAEVDKAILDTSETNKKIVEQTEETNHQLVVANRGLEMINETLKNQLQDINGNIDFIINTMGTNAQSSEQQHQEQIKLLVELRTLLAVKDEKGLKSFFENHSGDVMTGIGLVLTAIQMM